MTRDARATNIRVGMFLGFGLLVTAAASFALGSKNGLFEGKSTLYVHFADISGLVPGAPVRLAGLDVGTVQHIEFPDDPNKTEAEVTLSVKSKYMPRIRHDSVAFVDSKGLLGDKIINISLGSPKSAAMADGGTLRTKQAPSLDHLATQVGEAVEGITKLTYTADTAIKQLSNEQMRKDISRISGSIANILEEVEGGEGLAHGLLYDPKLTQALLDTIGDARATMGGLRAAIERVDRTVAAVENGDGMAHELLYGEQGKQTMAKLRETADTIAAIVGAVRDGDGLLHGLVYEPENAKALSELSQAATRINQVMGDVQKGRGTLGGLAVDPSVYEDLKSVLGNVERNVLLKALIRFTIKQGDIERPASLRMEKTPSGDH
ncbi:MAG TPA: MlaD family protein [Polyangiales bacterium]|nr:MlaD family protein [Polyangiales bacterium]